MHEEIRIPKQNPFDGDYKNLIENFELAAKALTDHFNSHPNEEAPVLWIIRGAIEYFYKLDANFLGRGNDSGIPEEKADHFANNFYRLQNSMKLLSDEWYQQRNPDLSMIEDLRTLIVHSGSDVDKVFPTRICQEYKTIQLGRILDKNHLTEKLFPSEELYDYRIEIWADKKLTRSPKDKDNLDFYDENDATFDLSVYVSHEDIKSLILFEFQKFTQLLLEKSNKRLGSSTRINTQKDINNVKIIDRQTHTIKWDTLKKMVAIPSGDYYKETGSWHWQGYGLQRIYERVATLKLDNITLFKVYSLIEKAVEDYWYSYFNDFIATKKLNSLNPRVVFSQYTPSEWPHKVYLENKMALNVVTEFSIENGISSNPDLDYLCRFLQEIDTQGLHLTFNHTATNVFDNLYADYFIYSVDLEVNRLRQRQQAKAFYWRSKNGETSKRHSCRYPNLR